MKAKYYIAYGSNLNVGQMRHRCPCAVPVGVSSVKDYKLVFCGNSRSGVANIEPCDGESVPVGIWAISPSDENALDRYEGYPWLYEKKVFTLPVNGKTVKAMAYIMTPGHQIAAPTRYYLNTILEGYGDFGFDTAPLLDAADEAAKEAGA